MTQSTAPGRLMSVARNTMSSPVNVKINTLVRFQEIAYIQYSGLHTCFIIEHTLTDKLSNGSV